MKQLNLINTEILKEAGRAILNYFTPIIGLKTSNLNERPILLGSATFVQYGKDRGLLTAQHVIKKTYYSKCEEIGLIVLNKEYRFKIKRKYLQEQATRPDSTEYGPDIAFIKIPEVKAIE